MTNNLEEIVAMSYAERRKQCEESFNITSIDGIDVCPLSGSKCCGYSCVSKRYWRGSRDEVGKHRFKKVLEGVGDSEAKE